MNFFPRIFLIIFFLIIPNFCFGKDLLIFHDTNFLGCLNCSEYNANSICNQYGTYGNEYSGNSVWNEYGTYGSPYSSNSPWNSYSTSAPVIVDREGKYYGKFSINVYSGFTQSNELEQIFNYHNGELDKVRDDFCRLVN